MKGSGSVPRALALLCACACLLPACGTATRARLAMFDFQEARPTPETWARLRGRDPTLAPFWIKSALPDPNRGEFSITPAESLALLEEARRFVPRSDDLLLVQLSQLVGHPVLRDLDAAAALATDELARTGGAARRAFLCEALATAQLEAGRLDEARDTILRLGGGMASQPPVVARLWTLHARRLEQLGRSADADASFDLGLQRGPSGLWTLYFTAIQPDPRDPVPPPERAAARQLVTRALERHPRHADLAFVAALDVIHQGDFVAGEQRLVELPQPLPPRLLGQVVGARAEVAASQGRLAEAALLLETHLDAFPLDLGVLQTLVMLHTMHGVPDDDTVMDRLWTAYAEADRFTQPEVERLARLVREPRRAADAPAQDHSP